MSVRILIGDMRERLRDLPDNSVDSVVCDPPYHLTANKKGGSGTASESRNPSSPYGKVSRLNSAGFMGQQWDGGDVAFQIETWAEVLRVLKPGGHLIAFSGTRTYHRMAVAIEDAGFEVRDMISWIYGSGFPKSHNIDKALGDGDRCICEVEGPQSERDLRLVRDADVSPASPTEGASREVLFSSVPQQGLSGAEGFEPAQGTAAGAQSCVEGRSDAEAGARQLSGREVPACAGMGAADGEGRRLHHAAPLSDGADVRLPADANGSGEPQGSQSGEQSSVEPRTVADERGSQARGGRALCGGCGKPIVEQGLGTALKPSVEPICLARKPLSEKSIAANVLRWGTGALNIDGCRIEGPPSGLKPYTRNVEQRESQAANHPEVTFTDHPAGRWPANCAHDGSDEVVAGFPETASTSAGRTGDIKVKAQNKIFSTPDRTLSRVDDEGGSAARFFYCAKATTEERGEGNIHPTVKPVSLMRWLVRLVTPKGGTVLDPFAGSGSTLIAADAEQFNAIGCELSPEYAEIARKRIAAAAGMFADIEVIHAVSARAA